MIKVVFFGGFNELSVAIIFSAARLRRSGDLLYLFRLGIAVISCFKVLLGHESHMNIFFEKFAYSRWNARTRFMMLLLNAWGQIVGWRRRLLLDALFYPIRAKFDLGIYLSVFNSSKTKQFVLDSS